MKNRLSHVIPYFVFVLLFFHCTEKNFAQTKDSVINLSSKPISSYTNEKKILSPKSLILPGAFITYGFFSLGENELRNLNVRVRNSVRNNFPDFKTSVDDYLQYAPAISVFALNAAGIKGKSSFKDRIIAFTATTVFSAGVVLSLKSITHQLRPDSSAYNSFPSGHVATAFAGAEFLNQEYGSRSFWYSVAGYTVATATAILRVMNNRHWLSDVIAGAGFGILSTKFTYWLYYKLKSKNFMRKNQY
jgi:membrane-associated phospholipid phosphatase